MATTLKSIVRFVGVPPGATVSLPHNLRWSPPGGSDQPQVPDHVEGNAAGFMVTADATLATVTNTGPDPASIDVLCELWHTIERPFGDAAVLSIIPRPYVLTPSGSGGGNLIIVQDEGVVAGVRDTINFIGPGVTAVDNPGPARVDITISAAVVGAGVPVDVDTAPPVVGVSAEASRADHKHDIATAAPVTVTGAVNAEGASLGLARADHEHRLEVEVEDEGVLVSARPTINFVGAGVSVVDDGGGDRAVVTIPGASSDGSAVLGFGGGSIGSPADTRFLDPWYGDNNGVAMTTLIEMPAPRAGTLQNLFVRHNAGPGNANLVAYTVLVNGVATAITASLAANAVAQASDLVNSVAIVQGDRIALRATKAAAIGNGKLDVVATLELAA